MRKLDFKNDYPLAEKRPELIHTPTGKKMDEITMEKVLNFEVNQDDCRISSETLEFQAQIAESAGNWQLAANFRRAAELVPFSDEKVLEIYKAMRPFRSTKEELEAIAADLEEKGAKLNAKFVKEAIEAYTKRRKFRGDK